jgi:DnaJ-domain-containing protein 1
MSMNRKPSILNDILHEWPYASDKTSLVRDQLSRRDPIDWVEEEEVGRLLVALTDEGPELRPALAEALSQRHWRRAAATVAGRHA